MQGRLRGLRRGRPDDRAAHLLGDRARAAVEGAGALPGAAFPGDHRRGPRATAGRTGPTEPRPTPTASTSTTRSPCWTRSGRTGQCSSGLSLGGRHALQLAAWYPDRAPGSSRSAPALPWPLPAGLRRAAGRATRAGRRRTGTTGSPTTAAGSSSSCRRSSPSRTRSSSSRTASAGALETDAETLLLTGPRIGTGTTERTPRRSAGRCAARCWSCTATRTRSCRTRPAWRWRGGPAGSW